MLHNTSMPATVCDMSKGRAQIAVRVDPEDIAALEALAALASTPLREVSRSDVMRRALELGREAVRKELGISAKALREAAATIEADLAR